MHKFFSFLLGFLAVASLAGCATTPTQNEQNTTKTVKIGVIAPLSGPASSYGEDMLNAYQYIVDEYNLSQNELKIELVVEDGKCEWKDGTSATQKLIQFDKVQAIIGGVCSSEILAGWQIANQNKVFMIGALTTAPEISEIWEYVYRFYNDADVSRVLAKHIGALNSSRVVMVREQTDYGVAFSKLFKANFEGEIIEISFTTQEMDFNLLAKQIKNSLHTGDFLLLIPQSPETGINLLRALEKEDVLQIAQWRIAATEQILSSQLNSNLWEKVNGIKIVRLRDLNTFVPSGKNLATIFEQKFTIQTDVLYMVLSAEVVDLLIDALSKVGNNGEAIKDYVQSLTPEHQKSGYFGDYYFNDERTAEGLGFLVYELQNGELVAVE